MCALDESVIKLASASQRYNSLYILAILSE